MNKAQSAPRRRAALVAAPLLASALLAFGCGGSGSSTDSTKGDSTGKHAVTISDFTYKPASLNVKAGTRVSFTNEDTSTHTATSKESGAFETGPIKKGQTRSVVLEEPGTYTYYCVFHPFMKGTITVE